MKLDVQVIGKKMATGFAISEPLIFVGACLFQWSLK